MNGDRDLVAHLPAGPDACSCGATRPAAVAADVWFVNHVEFEVELAAPTIARDAASARMRARLDHQPAPMKRELTRARVLPPPPRRHEGRYCCPRGVGLPTGAGVGTYAACGVCGRWWAVTVPPTTLALPGTLHWAPVRRPAVWLRRLELALRRAVARG